MLALASSREGIESAQLRKKLGLAVPAYGSLVNGLQRRYLVDVVSQLSGNSVHETLRLTDDGRSLLTIALERMCELPE
jgi:hypothetical protein